MTRLAAHAVLAALALGVFIPAPAHATFSIVACDATRACGAAVATNNLAVVASVIDARAGVGAVASQFETNPHHTAEALRQLQAGLSTPQALAAVLARDGDFEGQDISYRQVGLVAANGAGAVHTGARALASSWAGALSGDGYSIQGNGLAGERVVTAMRDAFLGSGGPLAERLLAAVEAGEAAGGQANGRLSAALLVRTEEGGWQDVDLRVDASSSPLADLRRLLGMRRAIDALAGAERAWRKGERRLARQRLAQATALAPEWDRVWRRVARLHLAMGEVAEAKDAFATFARLNPAWATIERTDSHYAVIADTPAQR